jgi:hypothetical protein
LAESVVCHGSGQIAKKLEKKYGSPFAVETATFKLANSNLCAEVTRSLFETARQYRESFDVYCDKVTFEWSQIEHEPLVLHRGEKPERVKSPDFAHLLPEPIRRFTTKGVYDSEEAQHLSFTQGSGHGGSHPHLAHEFISAIVQRRKPFPDAVTSANWTMTGICAHMSAMGGGTHAVILEWRCPCIEGGFCRSPRWLFGHVARSAGPTIQHYRNYYPLRRSCGRWRCRMAACGAMCRMAKGTWLRPYR